MQQLQHNLFHLPAIELFELVKHVFTYWEYEQKRHGVILKDDNRNPIGFIRLPLHLALTPDLSIITEEANALYLSIESGNAAICVMEGLENVYHTTFSAYMTRKKQGFSQIKYLKKKGKSRAGSRVRLAETVEFFEKINTSLEEQLSYFEIDRVAMHCSATLIPFLYQCKVPFPMDKKDTKLYKIPLHIPQSNYTNLDAVIKKLRAPVLLYQEEQAEMLRSFINESEG